MRTTIVKWASIFVLLLVAAFWHYAATYQLALNVVVCFSAAVILIQAFEQGRYRWVTAFVVVALLFNPVLPIFALSGALGFWLVVFSIVPFALSLAAVRSQPLLSIPSITDRNPGSQSL